jgi:hypothetical protein
VCQSGCSNLLLTVIDPSNGKPVDGATVTATVGALAHKTGEQYLCQANVSCGTHLAGSTTDDNGQAQLIY